jgi:hypothetical protein
MREMSGEAKRDGGEAERMSGEDKRDDGEAYRDGWGS